MVSPPKPNHGGKPMIVAKNLSKWYGPFVAVRDINFSIPEGQVTAFLGPNGAGKSTTMKLLTGFLAPSDGTAEIGGFDVATHREDASRLIGYLPENGPLYNEMTPKSLLKYMGSARGMSSGKLRDRMEYVADKCSLRSVWSKSISKLSRGFRQRVGMAHALLHDPEVLILDEPTSG
ncbi:MAG: ABC transporter ATP-binding protein, partial [Planctomycetaceae bacterium]|nr:ABC transporter ATP-binding protein [Planctomycetaceae bacterium]